MKCRSIKPHGIIMSLGIYTCRRDYYYYYYYYMLCSEIEVPEHSNCRLVPY